MASTPRNQEGFSIVISFSVLEASNQLLENGVVYTFRWKRRSFFEKQKGSLEKTWANEKRGGKRIADVEIEEVGEINPLPVHLKPYLKQSGFADAWKWHDKIVAMEGPMFKPMGWLYKVSRLSQQLRKETNKQ